MISQFSSNLDLIISDHKILVKLLNRHEEPMLRKVLTICYYILTVGVRKARKLAGAYALPIVGIHHMEAHTLVAR